MKTVPKIGTRVMRPYGRKDYVDYGEIGRVTKHNGDGSFVMVLDDHQPFARAMWGSKAKPTDNAGHVHKRLSPSEVETLHSVYVKNARRFRELAGDWSAAARKLKENGI